VRYPPPRLPHLRVLLCARERRILRISVLKRLTDRLTVRRGGFRWTILTRDRDVCWAIFADGEYQGPEWRALACWLQASGRLSPGRELVVDAGANIGTTALPLARETGCRVLAIEPIPELYELLERNVAANGLQELVSCERIAVASRTGSRQIAVPAIAGGSSELTADGREPTWAERSAPLGTLVVETAPLAEILRRRRVAPQEVALVWADIQGAEGELIESSPELWQAGVPLYMELWPGGLLHQGTGRLPALAARHFRSFVHAPELIAQPRSPRRQPIAELRTLHDALLKQGREAHSDVLLLNAEPGEAARAAER
jgi:FkbM family methyltransferase